MNKRELVQMSIIAIVCAALGALSAGAVRDLLSANLKEEPKTFTITVPLSKTLNAHADHAHTPDGPRSDWEYGRVVLDKNMAVTGMRAIIENAPPEIIHHLSLVSLGLPDVMCGNSTHAKQREYYTLSRSNFYDPVSFETPYALMLKKGEELSLEVMTHVLEKPFGPGGTYPDAVVTVELTYEEMNSNRTDPVTFVRLRLDDSECAEPLMHQAFVVPKGDGLFTRTSSSSAEGESSDTYTFGVPGVMLDRSTNVWGTKGGQTVDVIKNNAILETYTVQQGEEPWKWTIPLRRDPVRVAAGDTLSIQATYSQSTTTDIMDASGMFGFYFAPEVPRVLKEGI